MLWRCCWSWTPTNTSCALQPIGFNKLRALMEEHCSLLRTNTAYCPKDTPNNIFACCQLLTKAYCTYKVDDNAVARFQKTSTRIWRSPDPKKSKNQKDNTKKIEFSDVFDQSNACRVSARRVKSSKPMNKVEKTLQLYKIFLGKAEKLFSSNKKEMAWFGCLLRSVNHWWVKRYCLRSRTEMNSEQSKPKIWLENLEAYHLRAV